MSAHFRALYYTHYLSLGFILVLMVLRIIVLLEVAINTLVMVDKCHVSDHIYRIEQQVARPSHTSILEYTALYTIVKC